MSWETEVIVGKEQEFPTAMVAVRMATGERVRYVPERTCKPSGEWESISRTQDVRHVTCPECGHEFGMERVYTIPFERLLSVELPNYCPNCGAKVMGDDD